ncbi:hypothetical protein Hanom_Chr02g00173621 [Helianthus anomalus]
MFTLHIRFIDLVVKVFVLLWPYSISNQLFMILQGIMKFNNPNFHQLAGNRPNFKNSHWRSQLLTYCKTLDPC